MTKNSNKQSMVIVPASVRTIQQTKRTDAEWEAHDAMVRVEREKHDMEEFVEACKDGIEYLVRRGLSRRHLSELYSELDIVETVALSSMKKTDAGIWCLSGSVGCGKTFAAHHWLLGPCNHLRPLSECRRMNVGLVSAVEFARVSRYDTEHYGTDKFKHFGRIDRLVIDDLGVEFVDNKGSFLTDLDEILDIRWSNMKPTLITTNLGSEEFKSRYGKRVADRIRDKGGWINAAGKSLRSSR